MSDEELQSARTDAEAYPESVLSGHVMDLLAEVGRLRAALGRVDEILKTNITYMETDGSKAPEEMWRLLGN